MPLIDMVGGGASGCQSTPVPPHPRRVRIGAGPAPRRGDVRRVAFALRDVDAGLLRWHAGPMPHQDRLRPGHAAAAAVAAIILLVAAGNWPYGDGIFTRAAVFAAGVVLLREAHRTGRTALTVAIATAVLLFLPFLPMQRSRETWQLLDVAGALLFAVAGWMLRRPSV